VRHLSNIMSCLYLLKQRSGDSLIFHFKDYFYSIIFSWRNVVSDVKTKNCQLQSTSAVEVLRH